MTWTAETAGTYLVEVLLEGAPLAGCPVRCQGMPYCGSSWSRRRFTAPLTTAATQSSWKVNGCKATLAQVSWKENKKFMTAVSANPSFSSSSGPFNVKCCYADALLPAMLEQVKCTHSQTQAIKCHCHFVDALALYYLLHDQLASCQLPA